MYNLYNNLWRKWSFLESSQLCNLMSSRFLLDLCIQIHVCEYSQLQATISNWCRWRIFTAINQHTIYWEITCCYGLCNVSAMLPDSCPESRLSDTLLQLQRIIKQFKQLTQASAEGCVLIIWHKWVTLTGNPINTHIMSSFSAKESKTCNCTVNS